MNTSTGIQRITHHEANRWVGQHIHTTDGQRGVVHAAHVSEKTGLLLLHVSIGNYSIMTDSEHATILPSASPGDGEGK